MNLPMNKIIQTAPIYPLVQTRLENSYDVLQYQHGADPQSIPQEWRENCEVVVSTAFLGIDGATLQYLPRVKLVANFGVGVDSIDLQYCADHAITVTHTPDVLTDDVADLTIALILSTLRRIPQADQFVRNQQWHEGAFPLTRSLRGMKVGILGLGRIGLAIAQLCQPFGCTLGYYGPNRKDNEYHYFSKPAELAAWSDLLVVACPGGDATRGLVSAEVLLALGPGGYVINIARGSVIDESALVDALIHGKIAGAGLDVFACEPNVPNELLAMENVVLLPHIGSATHQTREKMALMTLANVDAYFAGKPLPNIFDLAHLRG